MKRISRPGRRRSVGLVLCAVVLFTVVLAGVDHDAGHDVTTVALEQPRPSAGTDPRPLDCNLGFISVKPTVGVGSIIGNAWARCDVMPPEEHIFSLSLLGNPWPVLQHPHVDCGPDHP